MRMKFSDVADRWTILRMKARLDEDARRELAKFDDEVRTMIALTAGGALHRLLDAVLTLMEANSKIWILEASIRREYAADAGEELDLREVGRRALKIREINGQRVRAKQDIDEMLGDVPDRKTEHASA